EAELARLRRRDAGGDQRDLGGGVDEAVLALRELALAREDVEGADHGRHAVGAVPVQREGAVVVRARVEQDRLAGAGYLAVLALAGFVPADADLFRGHGLGA